VVADADGRAFVILKDNTHANPPPGIDWPRRPGQGIQYNGGPAHRQANDQGSLEVVTRRPPGDYARCRGRARPGGSDGVGAPTPMAA
jgi:hypothetical protein